MKRIAFALVAVALSSSSVFAAPCRDTHGKFVKCPPAAAAKSAAKGTRCRDAKGHFVSCVKAGSGNSR